MEGLPDGLQSGHWARIARRCFPSLQGIQRKREREEFEKVPGKVCKHFWFSLNSK
jgi:hypothetical protein